LRRLIRARARVPLQSGALSSPAVARRYTIALKRESDAAADPGPQYRDRRALDRCAAPSRYCGVDAALLSGRGRGRAAARPVPARSLADSRRTGKRSAHLLARPASCAAAALAVPCGEMVEGGFEQCWNCGRLMPR